MSTSLAALADFIAAYEAEHGVITAEEARSAARRARARATSVRALGKREKRAARRRGATR